MPTYDYECSKCKKIFTAFHGMSAKPLKVCSLCGKGPVKRLIGTGSGLHFKGTGFYITDYKKKTGGKKDGDSGSSGSKSDGGSSTTKSDKK